MSVLVKHCATNDFAMTRHPVTSVVAWLALLLMAPGCLATDKALRIISGTEASITDFPWQVLLFAGDSPKCGGGILSELWVLTAAHCGYLTHLMAGSERISSGGEYYPIEEQHNHPSFFILHTDYDIGVVKVAYPFKFSERIQPVGSLASQGPEEGSPVTATGWGRTKEDNPSTPDHLMKVTVNVAPSSTCSETYGARFTSRMFCAASPDKDTCTGDSGGPVVRHNTSELVGIVSWSGKGCARPGNPGVYSSVAAYRQWIKETAGV